MSNRHEAEQLFTQGFQKILNGLGKLGYDPENDDNFSGTAERAARGFLELVGDTEEIGRQVSAMLEKTFPAKYKEMVISKHNVAFGVCPHHLLPVIYRISVAYIPTEKVLGISKLSRMASLLAAQAMLQEDLTHELARILHEELASDGSAAYVEGLHLCMAARGARAHDTRVVTSAVRGAFLDQLSTREEFIKLVTAQQNAIL